MRVVINKCFGGFGLSDAAYEKLIEWGVPVQKYAPTHAMEVIFDRELTLLGEDTLNDLYHQYKPKALGGRYWDVWTDGSRSHPLVVRVVEELGEAANGQHAKLTIVDIPDGVAFTIEEYDGQEHIAEIHRTWA